RIAETPYLSIWALSVVTATHWLPATCWSSQAHHMFNVARASSDMRLWSQGGSQTMFTLTGPTPATLDTAFSTMIGSSCADGQFGVVSVMSTVTARSSAMSTL